MAGSCSLSEQPFDVLQLLGASLSQLLAPTHLTALVSTCSTLGGVQGASLHADTRFVNV